MENTLHSIKQWAEEDRPREKLLLKGKSALSNAELIAILLGSGTHTLSAVQLSQQVLAHAGNDLHRLATMTVKDLMKFKGIGEAKAITIVGALELGRRRKDTDILKQPIIHSSSDIYQLMRSALLDLDHEEFWIVLLKRNNEVLEKVLISRGGVSGTIADPKLIFRHALENLASAVVLVHNHPSGNMRPSESDIRLTRKLKQAGQLLEVEVLDHIIFTNTGYYSFADESML